MADIRAAVARGLGMTEGEGVDRAARTEGEPDREPFENWLLSCSMAWCVLFPHYPIYKEQIKGLELISSVLFAFAICCCQLSI